MSNRIKIAKITTAHGIKGFVKLKLFAEDPKDIEQYNPLFIEDTNDTLTVELKNAIKGGWVAKIDGIDTRNQAEELRNKNLYIDESALPEASEDEFYYKDLIGMAILDNNKNIFGKVLSTQNYGAGDLLEIQPNNGATFFFPLNSDTCPIIDNDKKTIQTVDIENFVF
ncbi:MAG: ribosome maturation factor RimM [Bdellovibrionales bacterium]